MFLETEAAPSASDDSKTRWAICKSCLHVGSQLETPAGPRRFTAASHGSSWEVLKLGAFLI